MKFMQPLAVLIGIINRAEKRKINMRKIVSILIVTMISASLMSVPARAAVIGAVYGSDIGVMIDSQPIKSYNIDDNMYVIAEELRSYGFNVDWDADNRTLKVYKNGKLARTTLDIDEINIKKSDNVTKDKIFDIYSTDIKTYVANDPVNAKSIDGQIMIKVRELERYGKVTFNEEKRLAEVDIAKSCLEWDFEHAQKQELQIDENTVYVGQIKDGVPYGVGKMTKITKDVPMRWATRSLGSSFGDYEDRNIFDTADLVTETLAYFKDGEPVQTVYKSVDSVEDVVHHPHYTGDHIFNYDKLEYYENGEPVYGISLKTVDTFDNEGGYKLVYGDNAEVYDGRVQVRRSQFDYSDKSNKYDYSEKVTNNYLYCYKINSYMINGKSCTVKPYSEPVKFTKLINEKAALDADNNLYIFNESCNYSYIAQPAYIRRNVKACYEAYNGLMVWISGERLPLYYYILSMDNKLYRTTDLFDESKDILIAENVKLIEKDSYSVYMTDSSDTLYKITDQTDDYKIPEKFPLIKLEENVKDFCLSRYGDKYVLLKTYSDNIDVFYMSDYSKGVLTSDGKLIGKGTIIDSGIKYFAHDKGSWIKVYIKEDGSLWGYAANTFSPFFDKAEEPVKLGDGFKEASVSSYTVWGLKEDGSLWKYYGWAETAEPVKVADNVIDFKCNESNGTVLLNTGEIITISQEGEIKYLNIPGTIIRSFFE